MTLAVWDTELETGIGVIDAQHRNLFGVVNELAESVTSGQASDKAGECLDFLAKYCLQHFQTEELFMQAMDYPELATHKLEHERLVTKLQILLVKQAKGYFMTTDVAAFLGEWLRHHIQEADMGYVQFTRAIRKDWGPPA